MRENKVGKGQPLDVGTKWRHLLVEYGNNKKKGNPRSDQGYCSISDN